jgi:hypothetical protein
VHGNIYFPAEKGILDFLHKKAFSADLGQGNVLYDVAFCFDHDDVNGYTGPLIFEPFPDKSCLREGEGASPGAYFQCVSNISILLCLG